MIALNSSIFGAGRSDRDDRDRDVEKRRDREGRNDRSGNRLARFAHFLAERRNATVTSVGDKHQRRCLEQSEDAALADEGRELIDELVFSVRDSGDDERTEGCQSYENDDRVGSVGPSHSCQHDDRENEDAGERHDDHRRLVAALEGV